MTNKFFRRTAPLLVAFVTLCCVPLLRAEARPPQGVSDVVLVLPFENVSGQPEFNWVGESFADSLVELLGSHGLRVVSGDARELAYQRLRLPLTVIPSRATAIKLARDAGATLVVLGTYEVTPARDEKSVAEVRGNARLVRVNEGRVSGRQTPDGRWASHEFFFGDALVNLQTVQGKLAYQILYEQDDKLPFSQNLIVEQATKVPARAFESYVKGTMLGNTDQERKSAYLQNAMREYERANPGSVYKQAAFELGHLHYARNDYKKAAEYFSLIQRRDPHFAESAFYAALSYWRAGELQSALDSLLPLTSDTPLTSVYNNAGALAAQIARSEKDAARRGALLKQAVNILGRAAESAPEDAMVRFNYGSVLMQTGDYQNAAAQLGAAVEANPRDAEALFLLAKSLEKVGQAEAAAARDNEARKIYPGYADAQVEWQDKQTARRIGLRLRGDFNRAEFLTISAEPPPQTAASARDLLVKARELYAAGGDDAALAELRDVIRIEPMNAEAYLLSGRIYMRRGELASAINQLKTSIFWDTDRKLIDAHILLGRIFLERNDRTQALAYAQSAMQIDPNNQEALALQRQLQVGIK